MSTGLSQVELALVTPGTFMKVFGPGDEIRFGADASQDSRTHEMEVLLLGGAPIREPIAWMGPFVMNTKSELIQAYEDFQAGRLGTIPAPHEGLGGSA